MQYQYIIGQTPIDEEEKLGLIPSLITRVDLDKSEQANITEARKWLMNKNILSKYDLFREAFLLNLHQRMFKYVWKWAGEYRKSNKNIGVEYYEISLHLRQLLDDTKFWLDNNTYTSTELAIIFHHRLVKIHLFANGNGRHSRLMADAIIAKYNGSTLSWGSNSDLTKPDEIRKRYIFSLREADHGNYEPLLEFARS
jgi:Fic-DOC domain mobile mystery protein B